MGGVELGPRDEVETDDSRDSERDGGSKGGILSLELSPSFTLQ